MGRKVFERVNVLETGLLVPRAKSTRLSSMAKPTSSEASGFSDESVSARLTHETEDLLAEARVSINLRMSEIKSRFPPGKQNKMFSIRYGDPEQLKRKCLKEIFAVLELSMPPKFNPIAALDYSGQEQPRNGQDGFFMIHKSNK